MDERKLPPSPQPTPVATEVPDTELTVPGATLVLDSNTEANFSEQFSDTTKEQKFTPTPGAFMTPQKLMKLLKNMVDTDQVTPHQARQMRQQFGISQAYFTGKKVSREEKNAKKRTADASRRENRYNESAKGQKRNNGYSN